MLGCLYSSIECLVLFLHTFNGLIHTDKLHWIAKIKQVILYKCSRYHIMQAENTFYLNKESRSVLNSGTYSRLLMMMSRFHKDRQDCSHIGHSLTIYWWSGLARYRGGILRNFFPKHERSNRFPWLALLFRAHHYL